MNILITGGAGFIGSHVVDSYINAGHRVIIIDNLVTGRKENLHPDADFIQTDIRDESLATLFREKKFDVVNHHAAQMDVRKSVDDPKFDASVNILGTLNLLEQARATGVKKFIFASTGGAIYGEQEYFPADEQHPTRPLSPYGVTKLAVEKYLYYYHEIFGLDYAILRYANVYGQRQNPHGEAGVIAIFTDKLLGGGQPVINGDGTQTRDYVFINDVVIANLLALSWDGPRIYNIGTGIESSVNDIFLLLREATGSTAQNIYGPAKKGEQQRSVISSALLARDTGWKPDRPLKEGLRHTVEFFQSAR
jgi:UDP-glucose 4-epimerase